MKILLVASPSSFTEQLKKAFIKNGAEIIHVNDREIKISPIFKNNVFLWRLIRKLPKLKAINNGFFNRALVNLCNTERPDVLFVNKGMTISPQTLKEIKSMGAKTVNWFPENVKIDIYRNWFLSNVKLYDYFISFDSSILDYEGNTFYVPVGVDPDKFIIPNLSQSDYDKYSCNLCFIGAYSRDREHYLSRVKDLGLRIFGWKGWETSSLKEFYGGPLSLEESIKVYNCAKICINMNTTPPVNGVNLKTFEIPLAGGFQLSDFRKDVADLFVIGTEIEIFHDENELRTKSIFYMENEQLRKSMIQAGRMRVLRDHTLEKRVGDMLRIIEDKK